MQTVQTGFLPLSYKAEWQRGAIALTEKSFHNVGISDLSYEIMMKFGDKIHKEKRWESWKASFVSQFGKLERETTYALAHQMMARGFRLLNLDNMAEKLGDSSVRKCFYNDVQCIEYGLEDSRRQADLDTSMGFIKDLSKRTLEEVAVLMKAHESWRSMGDALGFSLGMCLWYDKPLTLLQEWVTKFPEGTLKRIYYEAERLGFADVCEYLNAIPLQGFSEIEIPDPYARDPGLRPTTIFDMNKLDEIYGHQIDWEEVSKQLKKSCKNGICISHDVPLYKVGSALNSLYKDKSRCFDQFMEAIRLGNFEPKNGKGLTFNQVAYLAEKNRRINDIHRFLSVEMQKQDLDLFEFVQKMMSRFCKECGDFERHIEQMVPKRHYSSFIAAENKKKIEKV